MYRVKDVFDVWFDSGAATFSSLHWPFENRDLMKKIWRVSIVMEGQDQIRGWFDRLLDVSMASIGDYPFDRILMFGWVVDEKGQKMSKKLGNVIWAFDAYNKLGADILRFYILWKASPWETISFSLSEAEKEISRIFNILINVTRYIIERGREVGIKFKELKYEDRWLISKFNSFIKEIRRYVEETGEINKYVRSLENFGVNVVSRIYIKLVRERVQVEKDSTPISLLLEIWKKFLIALAPVSPFLAEYLYQKLGEEFGVARKTIFLEEFPKEDEKEIDKDLEKEVEILMEIFDYIANVRSSLGIKQRYPVKFVVLPREIKKEIKNLEGFVDLAKRFLNSNEILFEGDREVSNYVEVESRFGVIKVSKDFDFDKAFISELARNIQETRKKLGYKVFEKLLVRIYAKEENIRNLIENNIKILESRTNSKIEVYKEGSGVFRFEILGKNVEVNIEKKRESLIDKIKKIFKL